MSLDTVTSSVTLDNLIASPEIPQVRVSGTVATSQTLALGAAVGKKTVAAGTVVAGTNTGNGTCTLFALTGGVIPQIGSYTFTLTAALVGKLTDPNGVILADSIALNDGTTTAIDIGGLGFTITDGATPFAAADVFTLPVAAGSGQLVKCDKAAVDGSQEIYGIALEAVTTTSSTAVIPVALTGNFNSDTVTFVSGTAYTDVEANARLKGIFFTNGSF